MIRHILIAFAMMVAMTVAYWVACVIIGFIKIGAAKAYRRYLS